MFFSADSSDDDEDTELQARELGLNASAPASSPPPLVPPHRTSGPASNHTPMPRLQAVREEIFIDSHKQSRYIQDLKIRRSTSRSPTPPSPPPPVQKSRKQPPPKPPRGSTLLEDDVFPPAEAQKVIRKVDSIVDMDSRKLYHNYRKIGLKGEEKGEEPRLVEGKSRLRRQVSWSSEDLRKRRRGVTSLVKMFENGESSSSGGTTGSSPPPFRSRVPEGIVRGVSAPALPPRPTRPSLPPKPSAPSGEPPVIPPHTPAPLVPPRPSGRMVSIP